MYFSLNTFDMHAFGHIFDHLIFLKVILILNIEPRWKYILKLLLQTHLESLFLFKVLLRGPLYPLHVLGFVSKND